MFIPKSHVRSVSISLLVLLCLQASSSIRHLHVKHLRTLQDSSTSLTRHTVCDLSSVSAIVHKEKLQVSNIVDEELLETTLQHVASFLVGALADVWINPFPLNFRRPRESIPFGRL